jgi:hypothetical protein
LNCVPCGINITSDTRFQIEQHFAIKKHVKAVENQRDPKEKQLFVNAAFENQGKISQFNLDFPE